MTRDRTFDDLRHNLKHKGMLKWALIFLVIALAAFILGLGGVAGMAALVARVLLFIFLVLLLVPVVHAYFRDRPPGEQLHRRPSRERKS